MRRILILVSIAVLTLCYSLKLYGQELQIGIIDLYGMRKVSPGDVRAVLTFKEGDTIADVDKARAAGFRTSEDRLMKLPGISSARIQPVCCEAGRLIIYVGIQERDAPALKFRAAPHGSELLPADIIKAEEDFSRAMSLAIERGDSGEDRSKGHSLMHDPSARAIQERFVVFASRDLALLRRVLRNSSDAGHRGIAAQMLGYASDKQAVIKDLVGAMSDPSNEVRNNAMRALMVFAEAALSPNGSTIRVPAAPFIPFVNSVIWSDRNKAAGALLAITARRDPRVLAQLRESALPSLIEMAQWKSAGHAQPAFIILARIAGYSDEAAVRLWDRGERNVVIDGLLKKTGNSPHTPK